jgi:hypothetical protein
MSTEPTDRLGSGKPMPLGVNHIHFFHQGVVRQVGPSPSDLGIVQRQKRQLAAPIKSSQSLDLVPTETAFAVIDHDVGSGSVRGRRQMVFGRLAIVGVGCGSHCGFTFAFDCALYEGNRPKGLTGGSSSPEIVQRIG